MLCRLIACVLGALAVPIALYAMDSLFPRGQFHIVPIGSLDLGLLFIATTWGVSAMAACLLFLPIWVVGDRCSANQSTTIRMAARLTAAIVVSGCFAGVISSGQEGFWVLWNLGLLAALGSMLVAHLMGCPGPERPIPTKDPR